MIVLTKRPVISKSREVKKHYAPAVDSVSADWGRPIRLEAGKEIHLVLNLELTFHDSDSKVVADLMAAVNQVIKRAHRGYPVEKEKNDESAH